MSNMTTSNGLELCVLSDGPDFGAKDVPGMNVVGTEVVFKFRLCQQSIKAVVLPLVLGITDNSCSTKACVTCLNAENQPLSRTAVLLRLKTGAPLAGTVWGRSRGVFLCVWRKVWLTAADTHTHTHSSLPECYDPTEVHRVPHDPPRLGHTESPEFIRGTMSHLKPLRSVLTRFLSGVWTWFSPFHTRDTYMDTNWTLYLPVPSASGETGSTLDQNKKTLCH